MSSQLSKLHIRFIQTQNNFLLFKESQSKGEKLPLKQLYIKNSGSFYFANLGDIIQDGQKISLLFKESNDDLKSLRCSVTAEVLQRSSDEFDDALLFFQIDPDEVKQLLLLSVDTISDD